MLKTFTSSFNSLNKLRYILEGLRLGLQLEQYDPKRFLSLIYKDRFFMQGPFRQEIDRTKKMKAVMAVSLALLVLDFVFGALLSGFLGEYIQSTFGRDVSGASSIRSQLFSLLISVVLFPFYIVLALWILKPLDIYLKNKTISQAKKKLASLKQGGLNVIGVTGSYGKTSMKNILTHTLNGGLKAITSEGTLNTPMGISTTILEKLDEHVDVFVVEMGAFLPGDIKALCELADPDMGVITGITKQHLERMGSIENIATTKWELGEYLTSRGRKIRVNSITQETTLAFAGARISLEGSHIILLKDAPPVRYLPDFGGIEFELNGESFQVSSLAAFNAEYCLISSLIAKELNIDSDDIHKQFSTLPQVKHRLELIRNHQTGVTIIDDSFNGNSAGVLATANIIKAQSVTGKKIYLTPGLVELGKESDAVHAMLAKEFAHVYDLYLFVVSAGTRIYTETLLTEGIGKKNILMYSSPKEAHDDLATHLQRDDVIVFQNDATDNYS